MKLKQSALVIKFEGRASARHLRLNFNEHLLSLMAFSLNNLLHIILVISLNVNNHKINRFTVLITWIIYMGPVVSLNANMAM